MDLDGWPINGTLYLLRNVTAATYPSTNGDSGGVVYRRDDWGGNVIMGLHMGRAPVTDLLTGYPRSRAIFLNAEEIIRVFGLERF